MHPSVCSVCLQTHPSSPLSCPTPSQQVVEVSHSAHGVDMPEDVASIERLLTAQASAVGAVAAAVRRA